MRGQNFLLLGIFLVLMMALSGCGGSDDSGSSSSSSSSSSGGSADVNGTLTLPQAADGKDYSVVVDTDLDGGNGYSKSTGGTLGAGTSQGYSIYNVPAGTYYLYAMVQNVSSSGPLVAGDFIGIYGADLPTSPNASVPSSGSATLDITLHVLSGSGFGEPGDSNVNGTLDLPAVAVGKTYWVAIDNDMDGGNGVLYSTTGTCGAGTSVLYSIPNVSAGTYYVYAVVYVVSSSIGPPANGDYAGLYGSAIVPPSSTVDNININLFICNNNCN